MVSSADGTHHARSLSWSRDSSSELWINPHSEKDFQKTMLLLDKIGKVTSMLETRWLTGDETKSSIQIWWIRKDDHPSTAMIGSLIQYVYREDVEICSVSRSFFTVSLSWLSSRSQREVHRTLLNKDGTGAYFDIVVSCRYMIRLNHEVSIRGYVSHYSFVRLDGIQSERYQEIIWLTKESLTLKRSILRVLKYISPFWVSAAYTQ